MVDTTKAVEEIQEKYKVIGRTEELQQIILAHSVSKNILIEGEVGVGKTRLAKAIAEYYDSNFYRVDCSEELLPHNLVGYFEPPLVIAKGYIDDSYKLVKEEFYYHFVHYHTYGLYFLRLFIKKY